MTLVKICGITNLRDALAACEAGADALGLNFYPGSPRGVSSDAAKEIADAIPANVELFGVFVNADLPGIRRIATQLHLDAAQLHGDESSDDVDRLARELPVFKAVRVGSDLSPAVLEKYARAMGFVFDAPSTQAGQYGGTGRLADWNVAQQAARSHKIILAGGLNAENVASAILQVQPYGVDVASGVESGPGVKNHHQLRKFIQEARRADKELNIPAERLRAR
jgi:phosphoribosylanthranilate isomerase